ncbi:OmpA family protein [Hoeflea sp. AS16]|uniref:OmpA family protein n=1 Tax=Hoeflea sp. AS16 TaxID=3135779 RepID=UPI00316D10FB
MRNVKLWIWPGLAAVVCLSALAIWFKAGAIETDLRSRTLSALRMDHAWVKVLIKGRDLTLTGLAPDEESQSQALSIARNVYGVRAVKDASVLLPEEKPYRLSAEKTANGITLSGFVPNEAARGSIISTLTGLLPGIALSDQMNLARGAPTGLVTLAGHGLSAFTRFSTGSLTITDRTMQIRGQALNPDDHEAALAVLSAIPPSAGIVSLVEITPAAVTGDYSWSATKGADGIVVNGYAPNAELREAIMARAGSIGGNTGAVDQMRYAAGVPDGVDWLAAAETGLSALEKMTEGTVTITDRTLDVSGEASDAASFRGIQDGLSGQLPGGLVLGTADIGMAQGSSYDWSARLTGQGLELAGLVPSEAFHSTLLQVGRLKFGSIEVTDTLGIAPGAPEGFEDAALTALQALSRLDEAEVAINGGVVSIQGTALNGAGSAEVARLMAQGLPQGFSGEATVSPGNDAGPQLAAASCQDELNRLTGLNTILFQTGEAAIQDHSYGFLDRIVHVAQQCGQVRLEISGHTDSDGSETDNQALSERRARAVVDFMTAAGVAPDRLIAVGHGESQPLTNNETDEGKAANRRIEFRVLN